MQVNEIEKVEVANELIQAKEDTFGKRLKNDRFEVNSVKIKAILWCYVIPSVHLSF